MIYIIKAGFNDEYQKLIDMWTRERLIESKFLFLLIISVFKTANVPNIPILVSVLRKCYPMQNTDG